MRKIFYFLIFILIVQLVPTPRDCTLIINNCFCQWVQTNGPDGGSIRCFAKTSANKWFIGTIGNGVYYTTNDGTNWTISNSGLTNAKVNGMVIDSANYIYAATERGLFRSTNSGVLWSNIAFQTDVNYSIAVDANNRLFVSASSTVWMSTDYGVNWMLSNGGLSSGTFYNLTTAPNSYMYVNSSSGGIFRSTDFGANWINVNSGLPSTYTSVINAAPNNYLYAGISGSGIYLSTNYGDNWNAVNSGLGNMYINGIGSSGTMLFAGTNNGIYKSTNYGTNWIAVNTGFPSPYSGCASFGFISGSVMYAGTYAVGVLKSTDSGNSWFKSSSGINANTIKSIELAPNGNIFVGFTGGIYVSTNNGATFLQSDNGITNTMNNVIRVHPNGFIFAGTFPMSGTPLSGIFRSTNNGVNWAAAQNGFTYTFNNVLDFAFDSSGYIYAASNDNVYKSTNLGNTWVKVSNGITNNQVYSIAANRQENIIFAGTYGSGMFRSRDNGANWLQINNGLTPTQIMSIAINTGGHIFAGSNGYGVWRSRDQGDTWQQVLSLPNMQAWKVAINSIGHIYAGIVGGQIVNLGVWRSTDNGDNWTQFSDGIFYPFIDALAFDVNGYAYAGSLGGGLYKSTTSTPVNNIHNIVSTTYMLEQNYPNPFNPSTKIKFVIPLNKGRRASEEVGQRGLSTSLKVFDITGKEISTLINNNLQPGTYEITFDGGNLPSGIYFYQLRTEEYSETKRMILLK
jgi:photosystem II stability/assembly factor-like uncharacterized protein